MKQLGQSFIAVASMVFVLFWCLPSFASPIDSSKYSRIIWNYLETLCAYGPRNPGSEGYRETLNLIRKVGEKYADQVVEHPFLVRTAMSSSQEMVNLELRFHGTEGGTPILIGAHFDTRPFADEDPDPEKRSQPILGANDGGSGTAVLLGLAQYLSQHPVARPVHLVFFDGEDFGSKDSGLNLLGSTYYAQQLAQEERTKWPYWVLVIDMIGDKDLQIFKESFSLKGSSSFLDKIYRVAREQGAQSFKEEMKYTIYDDHYPFHRMGIPSTVLIDFDYPHWHTLADTLDKCSIESMYSVFSVVAKTIEDL
ncbi:MAG: M28 family peptidase [Nitrospinae bacterium]|nr:M28 family peptidase [Nitrospinota bacterium]MBL7020322.1 M28 family peptidase [Nitrospinaceae bacterium]